MMFLLRKYEVWWFLGLIIVVNALFVSGNQLWSSVA